MTFFLEKIPIFVPLRRLSLKSGNLDMLIEHESSNRWDLPMLMFLTIMTCSILCGTPDCKPCHSMLGLCSIFARFTLLALHNLLFSPIDTSQMIDISFFWQLQFKLKNSSGNSDTCRWQLRYLPLATPTPTFGNSAGNSEFVFCNSPSA